MLLMFEGTAGAYTVKVVIAGCILDCTVNTAFVVICVSPWLQVTFLTELSLVASYLSLAVPLAVFSQEKASGSLTPYLSLLSVA